MAFSLQIFLLIWMISASIACNSTSMQSKCNMTILPEARISDHILKGYEKEVRPPSSRVDRKTKISFAMNLMQIMDVNVKSEELTTTLYMEYRWEDSRLAWNANHYNGIEELRTSVDAIWVPNIILQNSVNGDMGPGALKVNAIVTSNGSVRWLPPAIYKTSCSIDISLFPFDWQNCSLIFRSAALDQSQMIFDFIPGINGKITVDSAFVENGEWELLQRPIKIYAPPREDQFQKIAFYLLVRRKPQFYVLNMLLPSITLSVLSCVTFFLPSMAGEKISLSISLLLGDTIFAFLFVQRMPPTSRAVPFAAAYLLFSMAMMIISIVCSVFVYNLHYRSQKTHKMSLKVKTLFFDKLGPFLQMKQPKEKWNFSSRKLTNWTSSINTDNFLNREGTSKPLSQILFENQGSRYGIKRFGAASLCERNPHSNSEEFPTPIKSSPQQYLSALNCSNFVTKHVQAQRKSEKIADDWKYLALIVDRLCLWIYLFFFLLVSLICYLGIDSYKYPRIEDSLDDCQ